MPCACGGGPGGKEDWGPGQGRGGSGHLAEKHEAWSGPNSAGVLLAASETESWAGPGGRTHLAEERAVWPGLRSQQDPVCRPCAEGQPQVPRHRHRHVAAKVPAEGAVAKETVGLGHGCREEGAGHRPPQEQSAPCSPAPAAHSLSRQSLPPKPTGQSQLKPPHRSAQRPWFLHGFESQKWSLAWQPGEGRRGERGREEHSAGRTWGPQGPRAAAISAPCPLGWAWTEAGPCRPAVEAASARACRRRRRAQAPPAPWTGAAYLLWCRCWRRRPPCPLGGHQCAGPACSRRSPCGTRGSSRGGWGHPPGAEGLSGPGT